MMKLEIINKDNNIYILKDVNNKIYQIQFEFHDIKIIPAIGDSIIISEQLLDKYSEEYSTFYSFGDLKNKYGRETPTPEETIKIITTSQIITLKRLYG